MGKQPEAASAKLATATGRIEGLIAEMALQGGPQVAEAKQAALLLQGLTAAAEDLQTRLANRLNCPPGWVLLGPEARTVGSLAPTWPAPPAQGGVNLPFYGGRR